MCFLPLWRLIFLRFSWGNCLVRLLMDLVTVVLAVDVSGRRHGVEAPGLGNRPWPSSEAHFFVTFLGLVITPTSIAVSHLSLPISHQPKQNPTDSGIAKIKINPSKVRNQLAHPVEFANFWSVTKDFLPKGQVSLMAEPPMQSWYLIQLSGSGN